jgi:sugar phosphate isomerase/epimerase
MKIATTIGEVYAFTSSPAEAVRAYEGTGFKHFDYSFYNVLSNKNDPFMGDDWRSVILAAKEAADELGCDFVQAHAPACRIISDRFDLEIEAAKRSVEACGMLGIKNMVIHSAFNAAYKYPEDQLEYFRANEPFFRALIPSMEKYGVSILFENTTIKHCKDRCYFPIMGEDLNAFVEFMNHPLFGAAWDVGHANMDDIDHRGEILTMGKNLRAIHVHDNYGDRDRHLAPFLGTTDYDSIIRGLIESGFEGYFTLEADSFFKYDRRPASPDDRLAHPTLEIRKASLSLLYLIAKTMLDAYGIYEE